MPATKILNRLCCAVISNVDSGNQPGSFTFGSNASDFSTVGLSVLTFQAEKQGGHGFYQVLSDL